ncbi:MAG: GlcG/HbpS family heme-binding protein [Methyloligellaceae bacterium]
MTLTLELAQTIIGTSLEKGREMNLNPLAVVVLDAGGYMKAMAREDGTSTLRPDIAKGKAYGAIAMGMGSRALYKRAQEQPFFINSLNNLAKGYLVPVPGGVLIRSNREIIGAVGITGDTSENDEVCAISGIIAAGFTADPG